MNNTASHRGLDDWVSNTGAEDPLAYQLQVLLQMFCMLSINTATFSSMIMLSLGHVRGGC